MAVVVHSSMGWLLDHRDLVVLEIKSDKHTEIPGKHREEKDEQIRQDKESHSIGTNLNIINDNLQSDTICRDECQTVKSYKLKRDLFNIIAPFKMDSQWTSTQMANTEIDNVQTGTKRKRKKKRKKPLNVGEELAARFHIEVQDTIQKGYKCLTEAAIEAGYLRGTPSIAQTDNNMSARSAADLVRHTDTFGQTCWESRIISTDIHSIAENDNTINQFKDACNRIYRNTNNLSIRIQVESHNYLIPPHSTFVMSDVMVLNQFSKDIGKFDLIVMDPPWFNKSVKRKKTYFNLQNHVLLDIRLDSLMLDACIVAVWVTNRCKHIDFVKQELFKKYNITYLATWFWLKITKYGGMIYDINSEHKKPYETLILGQYHNDVSHDHGDYCNMEENKVIVSVPCSLHSKKPPIYEILKAYIPDKAACLELFARNLLPGWTSWGNEVLLHQEEELYEEVT